MTNEQKIERSRAGMKRLTESRRGASILAGRRCCVCEAWIGNNAAFAVELPSANGVNRCRVACSVDCRDAAAKEVR